MSRNNLQRGFTLIEMLVVAPIVILAIGAFLTVIISMTGEVLASRAANSLAFDTQDALSRIEEDVKLSTTFLATNNVALTPSEAQGYNDDATNFTNVGGTSGTSLILNMVATTANPISVDADFIFLKDQPNPCAAASNNIPMTYNVVYFVKNDTLWRRTIMPSQYTDTTNYGCATPWQQPSCSPTYMAAQGGSVFCKTNDVALVEGVEASGFTLEYFTGANSTSANTTVTNEAVSAADRNIAFSSVTTVKATISATQTVGGRDVSQASEIRVSRLENNASAIVTFTAPTVPVMTYVYERILPGAKGYFEWAAAPGATGYTIDYSINGGAWQNGFTNQQTRSYTVTAPANGDEIDVRVLAQNTAGQSGYATADVLTPIWEPLILTNGWVRYDNTYTTPAYTKTRDGVVLLKGMIKRTAAATPNQAFTTLPEGYRPSGSIVFGNTTYNNTSGRIGLQSNGEVGLVSGSSTWFSLDTVRFVPPGRYTKTNGTLVNGWTNVGGVYPVASSLITDAGRVFTEGLINPGTTTNETRMYDLPDAHLPAQYHHLVAPNSTWAFIGIDYRSTTRGVLNKAVGSGSQSVSQSYMASSFTSWNAMTLENSWVAYGGVFTTPQYSKTSDNIVTLKGMIRNGVITGGTRLLTLPAGFRPKERILTTGISNRLHARIDILPDGQVLLMSGGNATWLTFDGITFIGEQ